MKNRKTAILKVARDLFLRKDYESATMGDIMKALHIAKGTIYHYFPSKESLLEAVVVDIVHDMLHDMKTIVYNKRIGALEKIKRLVKRGDVSQANRKLLKELHDSKNMHLHNRLLAETLNAQAPLYASVIEQGVEEGVFKVECSLECAEFVLAAVQFLTDEGIYPWSSSDLLRRAEAFPTIIESMLHAKKGSFSFLSPQLSGIK